MEAGKFGNTAVSEGKPGFVREGGGGDRLTEVVPELSLEEMQQLGCGADLQGCSRHRDEHVQV